MKIKLMCGDASLETIFHSSISFQQIYIYIYTHTHIYVYSGFPGSSAGKESACNAGNPSLIPG